MRLINTKHINKKAWVEIKDGYIVSVFNIPNSWSIGKAIFEYFYYNSISAWKENSNFIHLECICGNHTVYSNMHNVPEPYMDNGTIECPKCKNPWLYFKYKEAQ